MPWLGSVELQYFAESDPDNDRSRDGFNPFIGDGPAGLGKIFGKDHAGLNFFDRCQSSPEADVADGQASFEQNPHAIDRSSLFKNNLAAAVVFQLRIEAFKHGRKLLFFNARKQGAAVDHFFCFSHLDSAF